MDEKRVVELMEENNEKLYKVMEINNQKLVDMMDKNNEKLCELMKINNQKLANMMDEKIEANNEKISIMIDEKIKENNKILDKRFDQLEEKIIDNNFYFEEKYGKKIDAMFEKIMMDDEKNKAEHKEFENYMALNNSKLLSHEVRITKLEKTVNS